MSWSEAVEKCKGKIILVPHGSTEEHGYHLPLKTDALIAERVCAEFYDSDEIVVAPTMRYTGMRSTKQVPGTVGPTSSEYEVVLRAIISDFIKLEPKKILFFLAHDGTTNRKILDKLREEFGKDKMDYFSCSKYNVEAEESGILETGGHAGEGETSLALLFDSENVHMDKAVDEKWPENYTEVGISPSGVDGYPTKATLEKGKKMLEFYKDNLRTLLK